MPVGRLATDMNARKILVAMSGGVDSSVAAGLLREQGHDVIGLFMRVGVGLPEPAVSSCDSSPTPSPPDHQGCCSAADAADARRVAGLLGIPFYTLNFQPDFERIIDHFADEYVRGRTPNPCIQCNTELKFGKLLEYASAVAADYIATGHYARVASLNSRLVLLRGRDKLKDQSYFLYGIRPEVLPRTLFPVGDLRKSEVRAHARRLGLPVTDKPDSVEICFAPNRDYARVVRARRPECFRPGPIVDPAGHTLGTHDGLASFTIGQRRGLRVAAGRPLYVAALDAQRNTVVLGDRQHVLHRTLTADQTNFFVDPPRRPLRCTAKIRYQHQAAPCSAVLIDEERLQVDFDEPQLAVTPGQSVVLYADDVVLGGGCIEHAR
jgi:tRNA-uridine 2-sulfurtransferase